VKTRVLSDPDQHHVIEGLKQLEFLVVQDIFLSETAQLADVVLPSCSFAEKAATSPTPSGGCSASPPPSRRRVTRGRIGG